MTRNAATVSAEAAQSTQAAIDAAAAIAGASSRGAMRLDSTGGSKQQRLRSPFKWGAVSIDAFVVCTQRGSFTSSDVARMKAVSKAFYGLISVEFNQLQVRKATSVCDIVRNLANGATSGLEGVSGSLSPNSFVRILNSVDGGIYGKRFFDAGAGCGIPVLIAANLGAISSTGIDTPDNLPVFSRIFMKGRSRLGISPAKASLGFCDLSKMVSIQHNPDFVYTFWESINPSTRKNIMDMTSRCLSVTVFACTNAPGETVVDVCSTLNYSRDLP